MKLVWSLYPDGAPEAQSRRGSFWWKDVFSLVDIYRSLTTCEVGEGSSVLFWKDSWACDELLADKWPRLFSLVEIQDCSVRKMVLHQDRSSTFSLPLSPEAFEEYQEMQKLCLDNLPLSASRDERAFVWGKTASGLLISINTCLTLSQWTEHSRRCGNLDAFQN